MSASQSTGPVVGQSPAAHDHDMEYSDSEYHDAEEEYDEEGDGDYHPHGDIYEYVLEGEEVEMEDGDEVGEEDEVDYEEEEGEDDEDDIEESLHRRILRLISGGEFPFCELTMS